MGDAVVPNVERVTLSVSNIGLEGRVVLPRAKTLVPLPHRVPRCVWHTCSSVYYIEILVVLEENRRRKLVLG